MGDFVRDNAAAVLGAVVALLLSGIGVWMAEGGRRRRNLKQVHEGLEVLALMRWEEFAPEHQARLTEYLGQRLDHYLAHTPTAMGGESRPSASHALHRRFGLRR